MTQPPFLPGPTVDDGPPPSFDEYRWSQLTEENKRIVSVVVALKARMDTRDTRVDEVEQQIQALIERLDLHTARYHEVIARLDELEDKSKPPVKLVDETNAKIVEFLESTPDVKFTAITIRENLGIPAKYIHDRCKTLVRQGLIRTHVAEGRHPFYQALPKADPADGQPT